MRGDHEERHPWTTGSDRERHRGEMVQIEIDMEDTGMRRQKRCATRKHDFATAGRCLRPVMSQSVGRSEPEMESLSWRLAQMTASGVMLRGRN